MPRLLASSRTRILAAGVLAAAALFAYVANSHAANYFVWGELNTGGYLVQYSTYRPHIYGNASLQITDNVTDWSRFGLRDIWGVQVTESNTYFAPGWQPFIMAGSGSYFIPTGDYALNGRMPAIPWYLFPDNYWEGILTL